VLDLTRHPKLLRLLALAHAARDLARRRRSGAREIARQRAAFYENAWREAAGRLGAAVAPLGDDILQIDRGGWRTRVCQNYSALDDAVTLKVAGNKPLVYDLLARRGLPIPRHLAFALKDVRRAAAFLEGVGADCVVKPANGTGGGEGITTGVRTRPQLARAVVAAAAVTYGRGDLVIEEQVDGDNYRLLYLDGQLIDAVFRGPPTVTGDGRSRIAALVRRANAERLARGYGLAQVLLSMDLDMKRTLARQGLTLASVPAAGAEVVLKTVINENCGADNVSCPHLLCAAVVRDGAVAAEAVGARLAGVDIVTGNPAVPLADAGGVILEVNTTPGFYIHYHKRDRAFPVAAHVLQRLATSHGSLPLPSGETGLPVRRTLPSLPHA
jgi:cyanophycin synthetase